MELISIEDRKKIVIKGATKVISSTTNQAVIEIGDTNLIISGTDLEVIKLDLENKLVEFTGNIIALKYSKKAEKTGLIKRWFK